MGRNFYIQELFSQFPLHKKIIKDTLIRYILIGENVNSTNSHKLLIIIIIKIE